MASQTDVAKGREIVARWCNLAEKRLEYLTELFNSGRWRRFHSEEAFLANIREAKTAVETWRDLLSREASRDNRAIDLSWLGRSRTALPQIELPRHLPRLPQTPGIAADQPRRTSASAEDDRNGVSKTTSPAASEADSWAAVLDLATVAARYPLLRNTL
ncbi:TIGR03809 family protein [Bradyrhizobium sp.]|uniref:TIGR03809 family protein n=1 Tax=Bradyrhizobium sp. TaxID=376 RepID=UPI003C50CCF7